MLCATHGVLAIIEKKNPSISLAGGNAFFILHTYGGIHFSKLEGQVA